MTQSLDNTSELVFLPLGGCGEIGMNLNLYGYGPPDKQDWVMVDLGVTFGDSNTPGVDLILPDPSFIQKRKKKLLGLVLTHGHEDHIGAIAHLWEQLQCPVYATPFTAALVKGKLADAGLTNQVPLHEIPLGGHVKLGPFDMELVTLTHSILEPNALAIRTPLGTILHTGDWKIDPDPLIGKTTDEAYLRKMGDEGVLAMVCDSTNVFSPGHSGSEADVRKSLTEVIRELTGRVAVTSFASNVARVETVVQAGRAAGRHVCLVGRSMHRIVGAAKEAGYLADMPATVPEEEAGYLPEDKILYLCTGSQGEPRAALARIAEGTHPNVVLGEGDTVIFSSRIIPGNELGIFDLQNRLAAKGIHIITEKDHFVHVSGHPNRDELATMYGWVRPQVSIPVHGEIRHIKEHALLARELQVPHAITPSNGALVRLAPGPAQIVDEVEHGRLFLDGDLLVEEYDQALSTRKKISFAGMCTCLIVLEGARLAAPPRVVLAGVPLDPREGFEGELAFAVEDALDHLGRGAGDDTRAEEAARRALRKGLRDYWGKRTPISVEIVRV